MSTLIEDSSALINPEDEVRKLQDLVKKLERQNQILRSKQDENKETEPVIISAKSKQDNVSKYRVIDNKDLSNRKVEDDLNDSSLDDVALLDLDSIDALIEDDDSWLYLSPKKSDTSSQNVSPSQWARQEFDKMENHGKPYMGSLLNKLDESGVGANNGYSLANSTPRQKTPEAWGDGSDSQQTVSVPSAIANHSICEYESPPQLSAQQQVRDVNTSVIESRSSPQLPTTGQQRLAGRTGVPESRSSCSSLQRLPDRGRTDTSRSKSPSPQQLVENISNGKQNRELVETSERKSSQPAVQRLLDDGKMGISAVPDELADVVAVHVLARMQEESLRQSMTPVRKLSGGYCGGRRSENSVGSGSSSSSSPAGSPHGSQYFLRKPHAGEPHAAHTSTPNLASSTSSRRIPAFPQSPSMPKQSKQPASTQLRPPSRLRAPSPRRADSPRRQSPREGTRRPAGGAIPRISSASKLPSASSRPSGLRKPTSMASRLDESWKDGCY